MLQLPPKTYQHLHNYFHLTSPRCGDDVSTLSGTEDSNECASVAQAFEELELAYTPLLGQPQILVILFERRKAPPTALPPTTAEKHATHEQCARTQNV